jgi:hypothetical protein
MKPGDMVRFSIGANNQKSLMTSLGQLVSSEELPDNLGKSHKVVVVTPDPYDDLTLNHIKDGHVSLVDSEITLAVSDCGGCGCSCVSQWHTPET